MWPSEAVDLWKKYFEPLAVRLGSPAITNSPLEIIDGRPAGLTWLKEFLDLSKERGHTVDFVAVHWYGTHIEEFKAHITKAHEISHKKIWVTEFAAQTHDQNEQTAFFNAAVEWLERQDFVERYSWFGAMRYNQVSPTARLIDSNGALTSLGRSYV